MRAHLALLAAAGLAAACGSATVPRPTPEPRPAPETVPAVVPPSEIVFRWADAVAHEQNGDAADLFAPGARVVQPGREDIVLRTREDAVLFNEALLCQAKVIAMWQEGRVLTALFRLDSRSTFACPAPLTTDLASFTIVDGRITRWERLADSD